MSKAMSKTNSAQLLFMILSIVLWLVRSNNAPIYKVDPLAYASGVCIGMSLGIFAGKFLAAPDDKLLKANRI